MTYDKDTLRQIFQQPFNMNEWQQMLQHYFRASELRAEPERINDTPDDKAGYYLGKLNTDPYSIGLFYYQIQRGNVARKRVGLRNLVKSFINPNWGEFDAALVVFDSGSVWRLSFVCDIKGENTAAKRFTYVFGESDNYYNTPVGRFDALQRNGISFENIKDAFSVERLNKDFFNGYKERYVKFLNHINEDTKENRDYVKKLLGRLVFLQFLQKKGWMGVLANQQGWNGGDKFYLNHLIERYEGNDRLLSDVLEPLFFNTLNERRTNDIADSRLGENIKIPYLNGGLFDKDDLDKKDIDFPYDYFKELMDFFAMYNFTIDENDPEDSEIGIDPEMLGHIFENLLEDNKDKGAFYTPKEIVQYMSQESVAQYLKSHAPEELHTAIDSLIKQRVVEPILQNKENARLINKALSVVKVCDPAIGSGAFPMGVLNVLFDCRHLLYGFIGKNEDFSYAKVKRDIIQNNIYGVDIEKGAVDIARLRFWLALVVDENEPQPLPNLDYKIMCGDSLLHRFALDAPFQNVLKDYNQKNGTHYTLDDYRQWVYDYTDISDHTQKDDFRKRIEDIKRAVKTELSKKEIGKIAKVRGTIDNLQMEDMFGGKKNEKKIKALQKELKALEQQRAEIESNKIYDQAFEWRFEFPALLDENGDFMGFDIVIGNPPYVNVQLMSVGEKEQYKIIYESFFKRCDMFCLFLELGLLKLTSAEGIVTLIIPSVVHSNMSYEKIRDIILDHQWLSEVRYTGGDVFNAPTVDTTILICNKNGNENIKLTKAIDFSNPKTHQVPADYFKKYNNVISIGDDQGSEIFDKLFNPDFDIVGNHYTVFQGIVTGNNPAFVFDTLQDALEKNVDVSLLHPLCHGRDLEKYKVRSRERRILYVDNDVKIDNYLQTKEWLLCFKEALEKRREVRRGVIRWYGLQWPRVKAELDIKEKIMIQRTRNESLKTRIVATLDDTGVYGMEGIYFIIPKHSEDSLRYLLGILNSKLMNYLFATKFLNLAIKAEYVKQVKLPNTSEKQKVQIEELVNAILQGKLSDADTSKEESEIDLLVYHLYGLTYDEVLIVDPDTPITRDEYEQI
jgi:hypothetical protein